jgi:hypothetical protein
MSKSDTYEVMKKAKNWHHDIQMIEGEYVESVVQKYQKARTTAAKDCLLNKIIENYSIFRQGWANAFALYMDADPEAGALMHDEVVWRSAHKFNRAKTRKADGKAFNAYLVSALLNSLKNCRNTKMSHKNHPRVSCPICHEDVYQIDAKHLRHKIDLERYKKTFPNYPLSSRDGMVTCPITGKTTKAITVAYLNRVMGRYTVMDFYREFPNLRPPRDLKCPVSGLIVEHPTAEYPSGIMPGYSEEAFISDFPDFAGIITCPFTGKRTLHPTQGYLNEVIGQDGQRSRVGMDAMESNKTATLEAKQVPVYNPYTQKYTNEITIGDLVAAGTTIMEHLEKYATIILDKYYPEMVVCPFTGRKTHSITKSDAAEMGKTPHEFYHVACKYPLRKWSIKCALCEQWVDNIWEHLDEKNHPYAPVMDFEEFERSYGGNTKAHVTTNCFVEGDSGDSTHIADLLAVHGIQDQALDIEDSLMSIASDDLDKRIAMSVRNASTVEDVMCSAGTKRTVRLPFRFQSGQTKAARSAIKSVVKTDDFDFLSIPKSGAKMVTVVMPGRDSIRRRLLRMIEESDLVG